MTARIASILLLLALASCAGPTIKTTPIVLPTDLATTVFNLYSMAMKCWARDEGMFTDGIVIRLARRAGAMDINVRRYAQDIKYLDPFLVISIEKGLNDDSVVTVSEQNFTWFNNRNMRAHVERWTRGDTNCSHD